MLSASNSTTEYPACFSSVANASVSDLYPLIAGNEI